MDNDYFAKIHKLIDDMVAETERENAKLTREKDSLLQHIGSKNVYHAKRKITSEREQFKRTKEQLGEVIQSLDVDNWRNAVVRAKALLSKLESDAIPASLKTISPSWIGKVNPNRYKFWMNCCREQFLVALGELQKDAEVGLEVDFEAEILAMENCYLTSQPAEFIEQIATYITSEPDSKEGES